MSVHSQSFEAEEAKSIERAEEASNESNELPAVRLIFFRLHGHGMHGRRRDKVLRTCNLIGRRPAHEFAAELANQ